MTATTPDDCMTSHTFWSVKGKQYIDHTFSSFLHNIQVVSLKLKSHACMYTSTGKKSGQKTNRWSPAAGSSIACIMTGGLNKHLFSCTLMKSLNQKQTSGRAACWLHSRQCYCCTTDNLLNHMDQQGFLVLCHNHDDDDEWYKDLTITLQSNANGMSPKWNDGSNTEWWNYDTVYTATNNYKLNRLVALIVVAAMVSVELIFLICLSLLPPNNNI